MFVRCCTASNYALIFSVAASGWRNLLHGVAAGQFDEKAAVVQVAQAMLNALGIQLFKQRGNRGIKADVAGRGQGVAHVLELDGHSSTGGKVALDHTLAVELQDAAVSEASADRFTDFGHVRSAFGGEQQGFGDCADRDADDHLVGEFGQLACAVGTDVGGATQGAEDGLCAFKVCGAASCHDGQSAVFCAHCAARDGRIEVGDAHFLQSGRVISRFAGLDGGHVNKERAWLHAERCALLEQHLADDGTVFQQADHHVGLLYGLCGGVVHLNALLAQRVGFGACPVPGVHGVSGLGQAACRGQSHHAGAENGDAKGGGGGHGRSQMETPQGRVVDSCIMAIFWSSSCR